MTELLQRIRSARAARGRRFLSPDAARRAPGRPTGPSARARRVTAPAASTAVVWPCGPVLDQGQAPMCAGFASAAMVLAALDRDATTTDGNALGVYSYTWQITQAFRHFAAHPGADYATVFALEHDLATGYTSAADIDELAAVVSTIGPVGIGVQWYRSMHVPRHGNLTVTPDDGQSYHFTVLRGFDPAHDFTTPTPRLRPVRLTRAQRRRVRRIKDRGRRRRLARELRAQRRAARAARRPVPARDVAPAFLIRNSWGTSWGEHGDAWIRATDLDLLLRGTTGDFAGHNGYCTGWRPTAPTAAALLTEVNQTQQATR